MQYSKLLALFALLAATTVTAMPRPQEDVPEDSDDVPDVANPAEAGVDAGDADSSSTQSPDGLVAAPVDCKTSGGGTHKGADIQTLLSGWKAYSGLANKSGGPYLSGSMSTVFHTSEYDWTEWGGKGDKEGHEYCNACMTAGINAGASSITCTVQPGGFFVASFTDTMKLGTKP